MRFLHLGDLHIGKTFFDFNLNEDQQYILNQIIDIAKDKKADAVFISGDVYDKSIPTEEAVRLFDYFLRTLADNNIKVFVISGNHDSDERLNFGSSLLTSRDIYITSKFAGDLRCQKVQDEFGEVNVYMLPFVKASYVKHYYPEAEIKTYHDAVKTVIDSANIDKSERNVILAHQFVAGSFSENGEDKEVLDGPDLSGSESIAVQNVGLVEMIGVDCFEAFDYVALGHIHRAQKIKREEVRYSGSPLKYSLSEVEDEKSVPVITLGEKGEVDIEIVKLIPKRNVRHITGKMENLLKKENIVDVEDYIYVTLTDEEIINDAMGIFQTYYPNTVKIDYDNSNGMEFDVTDFGDITESRSFEQLISDFYKMVYGNDISQEEMDIMQEIAGDMGDLL